MNSNSLIPKVLSVAEILLAESESLANTQLHSPRRTQAAVVLDNSLKFNSDNVEEILNFLLARTGDDDKVEIPLTNIPSKVFKYHTEDFRTSLVGGKNSKAAWHTVVLTSKVPTRLLMLSLVKKLVVKGININELLLLETILQTNWYKCTLFQQVLATVLLKVGFATVNGAKSFSSCGKPLYKALKNPKSLKVDPNWVTLFFALYDLLPLEGVQKSIKLTFIEYPTKAKKFPAVKHIGVTNSMDGNKSSSEQVLDVEVRPESKSPFDNDKIEHLLSSLTLRINKKLQREL